MQRRVQAGRYRDYPLCHPFQEADAENLPFPDASFDVVLATFRVTFTPDQEKAASELVRVCKAGGRIGIDVGSLSAGRGKTSRLLCRPCLDWSERRPHLAGAVGRALCAHSFEEGWIRRIEGTRTVAVTPKGHRIFRDAIGVR